MKKKLIPVCSAIALVIAVLLILVFVIIPSNKYKKAAGLRDSGDYKGAVEAFTALGEYKDSAAQAESAQQEVDYQAAEALLEGEDYEGAAAAFTALGEYKDSAAQAESAQQQADYQKAEALLKSEDYAGAATGFSALGEYKDSQALAKSAQQEVDYQAAEALLEDEDYKGAVKAFTALGEYKDSAAQAESAQQEVDYRAAAAMAKEEDYEGAAAAFAALGDYKDSEEQEQKAQKNLDFQIAQKNLENYNYAVSMAEIGAYSDAYKVFEDLGEYNDSSKKSDEMRTARFEEGRDLFFDGEYNKAYDIFSDVSGWAFHEECATTEKQEPAYYAAECLFRLDKFEEAYEAFLKLGEYANSAARAQDCLDEPVYRNARGFYVESRYKEAKEIFDSLGAYKDSATLSKACAEHIKYDDLSEKLSLAENLESGSSDQKDALKEIFDGFIGLGNALDSQEQAYMIAGRFFDMEDYDSCIEMYSALGSYSDSIEKLQEVKNIIAYQDAEKLLDAAKEETDAEAKEELYAGALKAFIALGSYSDSQDRVYELAERYAENEKFESAIVVFTLLNGYRDSRTRIRDIKDELSYREALSLKEEGLLIEALRKFVALCSSEEETEEEFEAETYFSEEYLWDETEAETDARFDYIDWVTMWSGEDINVREAPTMNSDIISSLDKGECVAVIGETADWYEIYKDFDSVTEVPDLIGFVKKEFLYMSEGEALTGRLADETAFAKAFYAEMISDANIRLNAAEDANVIGVVNAGTFVNVIDKSGDWTKINHDGVQGYVKSVFVMETSGVQADEIETEAEAAVAETEVAEIETEAEVAVAETEAAAIETEAEEVIETESEEAVSWESPILETIVPKDLRYGYKDSLEQIEIIADQLRESDYQKAVEFRDDEKYRTALKGFEILGDYKDSPDQAEECKNQLNRAIAANEHNDGVDFSKVKTVSEGKLIVGTEAGFVPYEYLVGDDIEGIDIDIVQEIADALDVELEIQNMDFDGALLAVQQGKVDIVAAGVSVSEEREKVMDFSEKYVDSKNVIVVNAEDPKVDESSAEALEGRVIGVQQGNIADLWVSENTEAKSVQRYIKIAQAAQDLANGTIDCIVMDEAQALELIAANDSLQILEGDALFEDSYAIAIRKGNDDMTAAVNEVIHSMIESGKLDKIIASHSSVAPEETIAVETEEEETGYEYRETEEKIEIIPKPVIAVGDYLKIEDDTYKTMTVEVEPAVQVTDQEVMDNISESFTYLDDYDELVDKRTDGVVNDGDTVNIDYVGKKDGEAFDGGTATGYDLTIGSNTFIDGFEEGLIGKKIGDTVDLNLTFPEEYGVEELNGADVVFTVTINYAAEMPELTDELADKLSDGEYETADEYKESIRSKLQASNDETYQNAVYGAIMDKLIEEYPIGEYPEEAKTYYVKTIIKNYIEPYAQMYGMELDEFVSAAYGGLTMDELKEQQIDPEAEHMAQQELILGAIAEKEGITMTDEELDKVLQDLADQYGMSVEDILKYEDKEYIRMSELDRKVMEWLAVNVTVKTK